MSTTCPCCSDVILAPIRLQYDLPALGCSQCSGVLLSLLNYCHWRERHLQSSVAADRINSADIEDSKRVLLCPKCGRLMSKYRLSANASNALDLCAHCDEVWFDQGEWTQVEGLAAAGQLGKVFTDFYQAALRRTEVEQRAEQRWREQLGDDYEAMRALREHLREHPQAAEILAYLGSVSGR